MIKWNSGRPINLVKASIRLVASLDKVYWALLKSFPFACSRVRPKISEGSLESAYQTLKRRGYPP
jgi:hypothetical protein